LASKEAVLLLQIRERLPLLMIHQPLRTASTKRRADASITATVYNTKLKSAVRATSAELWDSPGAFLWARRVPQSDRERAAAELRALRGKASRFAFEAGTEGKAIRKSLNQTLSVQR
jgi:hypothetical protein